MTELSFGAALPQILLVIVLTGALFGLAWWRLLLRHGSILLGFGWIVTAVVLGAAGALRAVALMRRVGSPAARELHWLDFFALYAVFLAIVLAPPALALLRRSRRKRGSSWGVIALSSAGWSLLGIVLALVLALALDFANVPFVPGIRRFPRSRSNDTLRLPDAQESFGCAPGQLLRHSASESAAEPTACSSR